MPAKTHDPDIVQEISVEVYKILLVADSGIGAVERMIAEDKDSGQKLAGRARAYNRITRAHLTVLAIRGVKI